MTELHTAVVNGIRIRYRRAGDGPPVVLVHGWPQDSRCWRHLVGPLSADHTVIAPDLRGYGYSDRPIGGYDKRTMAADLHELIHRLGFESAVVAGHDRGARVAHRWALDHPGDVDRLVLMDIVPTREMWRRMDARLAAICWHWFLHRQPNAADLVNPEAYLRVPFENWAHVPLPEEHIAEYIQAFSAPGALRSGFADYQAYEIDGEHDDADLGRRLGMPVRLLWGEHSFLQELDPVAIWQGYAEDVDGHVIEECGHFLAEERPAETLTALKSFLA